MLQPTPKQIALYNQVKEIRAANPDWSLEKTLKSINGISGTYYMAKERIEGTSKKKMAGPQKITRKYTKKPVMETIALDPVPTVQSSGRIAVAFVNVEDVRKLLDKMIGGSF